MFKREKKSDWRNGAGPLPDVVLGATVQHPAGYCTWQEDYVERTCMTKFASGVAPIPNLGMTYREQCFW
jgi:hypothetical protein